MKYEDKTRKFEVKLESIDPTGVVLKSEELSMIIVDDQESMINNDRLFIHIGECLYRIDKKGFIIDIVIPIDNSNPEDYFDKFVSENQARKMIGNGWTVDVIAHIFSKMIKNQKK